MSEHKVPTPRLNLKGQVFGRLTVLALHGQDKARRFLWLCRCECGTERMVRTSSLRRGQARSCGCLSRETTSKCRRTHGHYTGNRRTPTYNCWASMIGRCSRPNDPAYRHYGERGIRVCERWLTFEAFLKDMGEKPSGLTIERKDNNGDYCPNNCVWATRTDQARNRRSNHLETYKGETLSLAEWSERFAIPYHTLKARLARGWPIEQALTKPLRR